MKFIHTWAILVLLFVFVGCSKKDIQDSIPPPGSPGGGDFTPNKTIKMEMPDGVPFDLSGATMFSMAGETPIAPDGTGKIFQEQGTAVTTFAFDKNKNLIMAGFVDDSVTTINVASTAKFLLYWGYSLGFTNNLKLTQNYQRLADQSPGVKEWIKTFTDMYKSDPLILSKKSYIPKLKASVEKMLAPSSLNIHGKPADVKVDGGDIRSGLQLFDDGISSLSINNYYRRRTHAFIYKMSWKDNAGMEKRLLTKINNATPFDKEFSVDASSAITSVTGELGKWIEDKSDQGAVLKTGPTDLQLAEQESEVVYAVRLVGPGATETFVTKEEENRLFKLYLETFTFDVFLPFLGAALSVNDAVNVPKNMDPALQANLIRVMSDQWKAVPDIYEEVKKGEFKKGLEKLMENLYKDASKEALKSLAVLVTEAYASGKGIEAGAFTSRLGSMMKILAVIDAVLTGVDISRITLQVGESKWVEEWKVVARSSKVRLDPENASVYSYATQQVSAVIKNMVLPKDVHANYEWACAGKFGQIRDTRGNSGLRFESADSVVRYMPKTPDASLSDGDNLDYIYVVAKLAGKEIGRDTAVINVRKFNDIFVIRPNGITLSGKEFQFASAELYLEPADGNKANSIPNAMYEYKVVWSTKGKHGKLSRSGDMAMAITVYNDAQVRYQCLDKDTREGKETVTARIYKRPKTSMPNEFEYRFHNEVTTTININNDEKKKILHIPFTRLHGDSKEGPFQSWPSGSYYYAYSHWAGNVVEVPAHPDAKSYSLRYVWTAVRVNPQPTGESWAADKLPSSRPPVSIRAGLENNIYTVVHSWGAGSSPFPPAEGHDDGVVGLGMAEVIITLK